MSDGFDDEIEHPIRTPLDAFHALRNENRTLARDVRELRVQVAEVHGAIMGSIHAPDQPGIREVVKDHSQRLRKLEKVHEQQESAAADDRRWLKRYLITTGVAMLGAIIAAVWAVVQVLLDG